MVLCPTGILCVCCLISAIFSAWRPIARARVRKLNREVRSVFCVGAFDCRTSLGRFNVRAHAPTGQITRARRQACLCGDRLRCRCSRDRGRVPMLPLLQERLRILAVCLLV
jgi:hypothetical protein